VHAAITIVHTRLRDLLHPHHQRAVVACCRSVEVYHPAELDDRAGLAHAGPESLHESGGQFALARRP